MDNSIYDGPVQAEEDELQQVNAVEFVFAADLDEAWPCGPLSEAAKDMRAILMPEQILVGNLEEALLDLAEGCLDSDLLTAEHLSELIAHDRITKATADEYIREYPNPTHHEIRATRRKAGLTQTEAGALIHTPLHTWQQWESGEHKMHPGLWELWRLKIAISSRR